MGRIQSHTAHDGVLAGEAVATARSIPIRAHCRIGCLVAPSTSSMSESTRETKIYLVRHPSVHSNAKGICYGDSDVQLEDGWESTLESLASTLGQLPVHYRPQEVWHSDLARCTEPAVWLSKRLGVQIRSDRRLRERYFGTWQSVAWSEIPIHEVERAHDMLEHPATFRPGGGETTDEVARRAMSWLNDAIAVSSVPSRAIVAVAHSGSITALCGTLLKLPPAQWTPYYLKPSQHLELLIDQDQVEVVCQMNNDQQSGRVRLLPNQCDASSAGASPSR